MLLLLLLLLLDKLAANVAFLGEEDLGDGSRGMEGRMLLLLLLLGDVAASWIACSLARGEVCLMLLLVLVMVGDPLWRETSERISSSSKFSNDASP